MTDFSKLSDREIDVLITKKVMNWHIYGKDEIIPATEELVYWNKHELLCRDGCGWSPSTQDTDCREVRKRIDDLELQIEFVTHLLHCTEFYAIQVHCTEFYAIQAFWCMQTTPRQQCEAALEAISVNVSKETN